MRLFIFCAQLRTDSALKRSVCTHRTQNGKYMYILHTIYANKAQTTRVLLNPRLNINAEHGGVLGRMMLDSRRHLVRGNYDDDDDDDDLT